ncbi:SAM-dependent methyltransferase [Sorangium cellulosum]|uniref:SAM-dependent methyltransferase n=1 Tax=Sorangium cellulosum TaxID=56 RepID=A0A2L0F6W6_SORCE|nr:class I SAM-dependent methyltransferase [Sorangium cellulosum]AUX47328.1 SAM-dependent methyltransferase [Sorangium cellulosum]
MYSSAADLYDLLHTGNRDYKDYTAEAAELAAVIRRVHPEAQTLLDVACGTAEHARLLTQEHGFRVDGVDINPTFVNIARAKLPHGSVVEADMTTFELPGRYDVILCLFSSIGYARTLENVQRTLARFRAHLGEGGLVLVEPWFAPGALEPGRVFVKTVEAPGVTVCRMSCSEIEGRLSRLHFEYLIGRAGRIERASEIHELGLFTTEEMLDCFRQARLEATYDPKGPYGRGLFLARAAA